MGSVPIQKREDIDVSLPNLARLRVLLSKGGILLFNVLVGSNQHSCLGVRWKPQCQNVRRILLIDFMKAGL